MQHSPSGPRCHSSGPLLLLPELSSHLEASLFGSQIPPNERKDDTCVRCAKIMQHKCEIHSFSINMATKILSCKQSEGIFLYMLIYIEC